MALIRANRESIDDRFSVLGFTVRTENPLFEIGLATDPELLKSENRTRRSASNFFSSHLLGVNSRQGEAVYLVPPSVVSRFVGQSRLYFGLATYKEGDRSHPTTVKIPDRGNMYVNLSGLTERGLRRTARVNGVAGYGSGSGNGNGLTWGGDTLVTETQTKTNGSGNGSNGAANAAVSGAQPAPYSDGYSDELWQSKPAPDANAATPSAAPASNDAANTTPTVAQNGSSTPAAVAQAYNSGAKRQLQRYQARPSRPSARSLLVSSYYQPSGWFDALTTQVGFFLSSAMWYLGVTDTTVPPHSAICQVRLPDGSAEGALHGSAFFISPRLLLTAAHVVHGQSELIIVPGKNGGGVTTDTEPFGRFRVSTFSKHPSYSGSSDFDMALICVPEANAVSSGNYFDLVEELNQSRPEGVVVSGYAARWYADDVIEHFVNDTIDPNRQHMMGGHIRSLPTDETFDYDLQTLGGTSGSPVYWIEEGDTPRAHMVGVHVAAYSETTNLGCRITPAKLSWIRSTAAAWGQTLTFSLGHTRSLEDISSSAVIDSSTADAIDPDAIGISEDIPEQAEAAAITQGAITQGLRTRARTLDAPLPDYPGASRFVPAHARNFTVGRKAGFVVDRIVVHITAGGSRIEGTIGWFQNGNRVNERTGKPIRSSAHYIVGRDGEVVQMVRNADTAHHASQANSRSIGIEHNANKTTGLNPTQEQYEASARLVAWLCQQYNLPADREHIRGHMEISPNDNHDCPSSIWDWDYYMACVQTAAAAMQAPVAQGLSARSFSARSFSARSLSNRAYARAQEIITPFYDPADPATALSCQADAFSLAREEWFAGVPNTTIFPHSAICLLEMQDGSGGMARGTGFYIGRNRILTCGHNLFGQASVDIIPGNNGQGNEPFGRCTVTSSSWRIPTSYGGTNPAYDLAVIDNVPIEAPNGQWFPILEELNQSRPEGVVVCGYSSRSEKVPELTAAIDGFKQHLHAGYIAALGPGDSTFDYPILTLKRASGSPVYYISDKDGIQQAYIVGVHTGSATDDLNRGCRLTDAKIAWITGAVATLGLPSRGLGLPSRALGEAFSVHWNDVQLVRQTNRMSCWAAAAAMVVGWRDEMSIPDTAIAEKVEVFDAYRRGLYGRQRVKVAEAWDLVSEAPASYTIEAWRDILASNGPIYIDQSLSTNSTAGHVRVLIGMESGGADDGSDTMMYFLDPARGQFKIGFNDFLKLYEGRTETTNGYLEFQVMHAEGPVIGRSASDTAAFSLGSGAPMRGSIRHGSARQARALESTGSDLAVALIPQPDKNACWAASMAMLLSYRRNASFSPETLANEVGASLASSYNWDLLQAVRARYGFEMIEQPSNTSLYATPQQWADWLSSYGPLWVVIVGAPHAVVIAGIRGNLSDPASVQVKVLNPWDTRVAFDNDPVMFNPPNSGYEDWLSFNQFAADFGNMAQPDYGNWRVLYLPVGAATAQSLGAGRRYNPQPSAGTRSRFSTAQSEGTQADDPDVFELVPPPPPVVRELGLPTRALDGGATVAIASTIAGAVMERLVNNDGDITWELDQLRGYKHPNDTAPNPAPSSQNGKVLRLDDWPKVNVGFLIKDEISAGFEINWQYNGKSVGNVLISNIATNDAVGWGLTVKAKIMDDNIVYPRDNPTFAALWIRFEYRFTHWIKSDKIAIRDIRLYGDGGYSDDGHWEQS